MESEHISKSKIDAVIAGKAAFDQSEVEHLRTCEECLKLIRDSVRQQSKGASG